MCRQTDHSQLRQMSFLPARSHFHRFKLCGDGYQVDQSITDAIPNFPTPSNQTDLWSFFRLANQFSASVNTVSSLLTLLRPLLSTKSDFQWSETLNQAFQTAKQHFTVGSSLIQISPPDYAPMLATMALASSSSNRNRMVATWSLTQAGSHFLSNTEGRYAIIELEMFAVCQAIIKCHTFLAGLQCFQVITDHNR